MTASVAVLSSVFRLAQESATESTSQGTLVVVILAVITLGGTAITAMGPTFVELAKNRGVRLKTSVPAADPVPAGPAPPPSPALPLSPDPTKTSVEMVQSAQHGLSMVEAAVLDYRAQRDLAMQRYDKVLGDLAEAEDIIREQAVYIAQLEGQLGRRSYGGRHNLNSDHPSTRDHR